MLINLLIIAVAMVVVIYGADRLTVGSVAVAERLGIPQLVIGLTIVAMGTSMPEFTVSLLSALKGTPDLAVGNVVGSNIFNALGIVGVAAMIAPMPILSITVRKDLPFALMASCLLALFCLVDGQLALWEAGVLFALFVAFLAITVRSALKEKAQAAEVVDTETLPLKPMAWWKALLWILLGLALLIVGSDQFVSAASAVAHELGVSDAVIGLTIVAIGTSLPELATSVVAARKGNSGIAIGNVIGSNVFNILFILGLTGVIAPMTIAGITQVDFLMLVGSMVGLWLFSFTGLKIARWEGVALTAVFIGYVSWLVANA